MTISDLSRNVDVWIVRLERSGSSLASFQSLLGPEEQERARSFRSDAVRGAFILVRACLRLVLSSYIGVPAARLRLAYSSYGKPMIDDPQPKLRFNVSHSGNIAAFAIGCGCEIGIDIEEVRTIPDIMQIATHFFAADETAELAKLPHRERIASFYRAWTRKEACIKGIGEGLSHSLNTFRVTLEPSEAVRVWDVGSGQRVFASWSLYHLQPMPDYVGAVAFSDQKHGLKVRPPTTADQVLSTCGRSKQPETSNWCPTH